MSRLLEILGSKYPIIQGPIGELNDPKMVAAVSEASLSMTSSKDWFPDRDSSCAAEPRALVFPAIRGR